jgi:hypothetical protein
MMQVEVMVMVTGSNSRAWITDDGTEVPIDLATYLMTAIKYERHSDAYAGTQIFTMQVPKSVIDKYVPLYTGVH